MDSNLQMVRTQDSKSVQPRSQGLSLPRPPSSLAPGGGKMRLVQAHGRGGCVLFLGKNCPCMKVATN